MSRTWLRWLPAAIVPAVIAAGALANAAQAGAAVDLPSKSADQVLAMVAQDQVRSLSGTIEQTSSLGLPQLPSGLSSGSGSGSAASSALELLTGSHTARVYADGPTDVRIQVMDTMAERDAVRHGTDVWLYSSQTNTATHMTLPARAGADATSSPGDVQTPTQLAQRLLAAIDPSTRVTVGTDTAVAGRSAYDLVLTPRATDTLIGSVSIAVDSATGLPLSVDVMARGGGAPAFHVAYTALDLSAPAASVFQFTPPPGATVQQQSLPQRPATPPTPGTTTSDAGPHPTVIGTGWDAVVVLPAGAAPAQATSSPLLAQMTQAVTGGRLLHTALVNVLLTDDGRVLAGSVPVERLQAAAAGQ
jgi:outer membrane lipoprotein-sorting protein